MPYVTSSTIARIEWNSATLSIWFHESGRLNYPRVPERVYKAFLNAESREQFYKDNIQGRY
ncbi:MAG: KTSC domain-containing protein [Loktanella sp.]|nr:KTSC domain-containing protein [Loktanella sp.]